MSRSFGEELERLVTRITEAYERDSMIAEMTRIRSYQERINREERFVQIYSRQKISIAWLTDSTYSLDVFYDDVGSSIAIGEKNYLIRQLEEHAALEPRVVDEFNLDDVISTVHELRQAGHRNLRLFLPIDLYVEFHSSVRSHPPEKVDVRFEGGKEYFTLDRSTAVQMFWSNKYIELKRVLLFDQGFGTWIFTPGSTSETLSIDVEREGPKDVILYVRTIVRFDPVNQEAIRMLEFPLAVQEL